MARKTPDPIIRLFRAWCRERYPRRKTFDDTLGAQFFIEHRDHPARGDREWGQIRVVLREAGASVDSRRRR